MEGLVEVGVVEAGAMVEAAVLGRHAHAWWPAHRCVQPAVLECTVCSVSVYSVRCMGVGCAVCECV